MGLSAKRLLGNEPGLDSCRLLGIKKKKCKKLSKKQRRIRRMLRKRL